jgi:hypothetical protein
MNKVKRSVQRSEEVDVAHFERVRGVGQGGIVGIERAEVDKPSTNHTKLGKSRDSRW